METLISDMAFWFYFINFWLATCGFLAFAWWWRKIEDAGDLYKAITYLFGVIACEKGFNCFTRAMKHIDDDFYHAILDSWPWAGREFLVSLVLAMLVYRIYKRLLLNRK